MAFLKALICADTGTTCELIPQSSREAHFLTSWDNALCLETVFYTKDLPMFNLLMPSADIKFTLWDLFKAICAKLYNFYFNVLTKSQNSS